MKMNCSLRWAAAAAVAMVGLTSSAFGAFVVPVTGWAVHNGTSTVTNGGTNSPTFTAGDNITVMGTYAPIELFKTGDSIKVSTTLTMATRTTNLGINALNTQLRIGLFDGPGAGGAVVANDIPNTGYIIEYTNDTPAAASRRLIRRQSSLVQTAPFVSPTDLGNGGADTGNDSLQGANVGPVVFELKLTRNGSLIDLTGLISGTDSVSGNPYISNFSLGSLATPPNGFVFDRVGFFFGGNVDTPNATLNNVNITAAIPEPGSFLVFALIAAMGGAGWWKQRRRGQAA